MAADPLRDLFGAQPDPLKDVFGTAPTPDADFTTNPLTPKAPGPLVSAAEGKTPTEAASKAVSDQAILEAAAETPPTPPQNVVSYLGHAATSGVDSVLAGVGDIADTPVRSARNLWLTLKDAAHQAVSGSLVGDIPASMQNATEQAAGTPFSRFAESMQRQSQELASTPDGEKYNQLRYATTDPAQSALLSPVRLVHDMLQSLPSTAAMATTVYLTRGAAAKAYAEAIAAGFSEADATAVAIKAAGRVASLAGAAGEGTVGGLQQDEQQRVQVLDSKNPVKSPIYQTMIRAGIKPADAKQYLATQSGTDAGIAAGTVDALTNLAEGPILGRIIGEGGPLIPRIAKGFAAEGIQEGVQGAGEQAGQNLTNKEYVDPSQQLGDQVAENVIASFAVGGLTGGLFAGVGGHGVHQGQQAPPKTDDLLGGEGTPAPPVEGRSYNVADAIAELKMTPEEAQAFVSTGKDPRASTAALEQHGFTPTLNADDLSSPIPDTVLAAGKGLLGTALQDHSPLKPAAKANIPMDVVQGLIKEGIPEPIARGVAAGVAAEANGGDETAINPKSGAYGLGQWLGSRKQGLFERYGPNPTRAQQIENLAYELKGGDAGGKSVLSASNEVDALHRYITDFMRPAAGKETDGDIQRGMAALGRAGQAIGNLQSLADSLANSPDSTSEPALTVEGTMAQAGVDQPSASEPQSEFRQGDRINVTQNGTTVPGTVQEVYGQGVQQGIKAALDDGTTFDEELQRARQYGAKIEPLAPAAPVSNEVQSAPDVSVPEAAQPQTVEPIGDTFGPKPYAGEPIDNEFTAFHPDTGTLGIPRAEMPQIKQEHRGAAVNFFEARGISAEPDTVPASSLKPSQAEFAPAKVDKFLANDAGDRSVLVSSDGYVLDGHHQWVAALDKGGDVRVIRLNAPIRKLIEAAHAFPSSRRSEGGSQVQPDMFGGEALTAEQMDARRFAPEALREVTKANRLGDLQDALDYVLRRSEKTSATPGDKAQSTKELSQLIGKNLSRKEATAYALELERIMPEAAGLKHLGKNTAGENVYEHEDGRRAYQRRNGELTEEGRGVEHKDRTNRFLTRQEAGRQLSEPEQEERAAEREAKAEALRRYPNDHESRVGFIHGARLDSSIHLKSTKQAEAYAAGAKFAGKTKEPIADQPTEAPVSVAAAEALREKATPHQDELAKWGGQWDADYGFINPGLKSAERIAEKAAKEGYQSLDGIKDVSRVGFKIEKQSLATDLVVSAKRRFGQENVTDKGWRMIDGDYFDRKLIISWEDGTKSEVQIVPDVIERFRHEGGGAELYKKWRSTEPGTEKDALLKEMQDGYAKAAAGTSWESLFNELKSASGNSLAASAEESETPGLVAKPGAERQSPESQTTAQGPLPETTPEATSRSSTSNSENSAIGSNVGNAPGVGNVSPPNPFGGPVPSREQQLEEGYDLSGQKAYGANNKIVTRSQADIARAIIRDKLTRQLNSGFDPEMLSAGAQLAAFHLEAGARKFADFAKAIADDLGVKAAQLKPYLAAWYNGARDLLEGHGLDVSDMDTPEAVRAGITSLSTGVDDIGENGGTNGGTATDQGIEGPDRASDAGESPGDVPGAEGVGEPGQGAVGEGGPSAGQLRAGAEPGVEPRALSGTEPAVSANGERADAGVQRGGTRSAESSRRVRDTANGTDYRADQGSLKRSGSWLDTANRNLDIIELVNKLDAEGRPATPEEQKLLAQWTGWGASEMRNKLFGSGSVDRRTMTINKPYYSGEWGATIERARELIKGADLETALQSTQYAHYTSEGVVRGMWDAMERMGFEGGRILEPGMGIGHFFTAAPAEIADHSTYTGVELDQFSAKIAKYLLPQENVIQGDFTKQAFPDGFFDAAIGNPPFAATKILNDPAYKKLRLSLHNYFFVKSLDKVRPGGLLAFVTSRYTMDALDPKAREFMADRADLVGAIRLPQTAFKENAGTEVVTDVLFFQRRMPGAEPGGEQWLKPKQISVGGSKQAVNEYFAAHPEMVLGRHALTGTMYRKDELTVEPYASKGSIEKQFAEAVNNLPENIYTEQPQKNVESLSARTFERDFAPASSKEGGLYVKDGKLLVVDRGSGVPVEAIRDNLKPADHAWLKGYVKLRDALKEAQKAQLQDDPDWEAKLDALKKQYAAFTKQHGRIKEFTSYERTTKDASGEEQTLVYRRFKWERLLFDVEAPLVESLEKITDQGEIENGPFLLGRTLNKPTRPKIETVHDALAVTLDELGKLDLPYLAKLAGVSEDDAVRQLGERVFQTPSGEWQTDDEYLSGNVLQKLEEAQQAAVSAPEFQRNVEALTKVQPQPLSYDRITVKLGAPWIKPETVSQFADEVLGQGDVPITYDVTTAHWNVEGSKARYRRNIAADYGTNERSALELLDAVLNNRSIKVTQKIDGKEVVLPDQTAAANEAAKKIAERFKTWLWEDSARTSEYVEAYNRSYNNIAPRRFNGDHLSLPGLSANFIPHPHVKRAVWRIIQTGNTYLAHAVGAGKTAEQIIGAQEQRRLGLIKKPMHVVPNHMLKQFSQEFLQLYPAANIMVADEQAFHTGNRRRFLAQAALNDPDAIIITHSAFGKIDSSPPMREAIIEDMIAELEDAKKEAGERHLVSRIEKQIEQLKRRFEGKVGSGKDKLLTFDELGVDQLLVDEAHEFRKLDFATNRVAKGIDSSGSARALDLFIKSQWLEQQNPGRSMIMASGTPVTNTMAELYTVMRYMDLKGLERDHIAAFDAWANMFGELASGYERNAAGGYEIVERFSKFVNVPELMKRVREFMDVLSSAQLGDLVTRPKINGGGPENVITPTSDELEAYMKGELETRLKKSREWKPSPGQPANPDPVINIITDARLASIDMRYIDPSLPSDPDSKLNEMISRIADKHREYAGLVYTNSDGTKQPRKGAAQIVFSPVGFGEQVAKNRGFDVRGWIDGELQRLGVKKSEIGWMSDANTHAKKEQLQKDVRSGKVRILIGSPKNMGTGLNVQDRLKVLHFLAPPWYPSDVTQPHGRIERQGNQNPDVDIYWYATKGTYDSTGWGMVARKQKFIDDAMSGDDSVRTLEDISEINQFEMAAALAAGDDRVIRIAALGGDVERLTRLKNAHADTQRTLRGQISTLQDFELPRLQTSLSELKAAQEAKGGYQPFSLTVDGQSFDKHGEAGDALLAKVEDAINASTAIEQTKVGELYGKFPVYVDATRHGDFQLSVQVGPSTFNSGRSFENTEELNNVGVVRSLEATVAGITSRVADTNRQITDAQAQLDAAKKKYGAPFPEESQLSDAIAERGQLQAEMAAETKAKEEAAKGPQPIAAQVRAGDSFTLSPDNAEAFEAEMRRQLRQFLPNDSIGLRALDQIKVGAETQANGQYHPWLRMISLAMDADQREWTLAHEGLHAMRSLGLFTEAEWNRLVDFAWTHNEEEQQGIRDRWGPLDLTEEQLQEEAVAELFGQYWHVHEAASKTPLQKLFVRAAMKALRFIAAVRQAIRAVLGKPNDGLTDVMDLLEQMRKGYVGARPEGFGGTRSAFPVEAYADTPLNVRPEASWTDKRIDRLIRQFSVEHNGKSRAYAVRMSPADFVKVTTPAKFEGQLREEAGDLDRNQLEAEGQTPFLIVKDIGDGFWRVVGHEGRHRMAALDKEGVTSVPIVLRLEGLPWSDLKEVTGTNVLLRQDHGGSVGSGQTNVVVNQMVPLAPQYRDTLKSKFGGPSAVPFRVSEAAAPTPDFGGETERRWQEANGLKVDGPGIIEKAKTGFHDFIQGWSRHYENLPNTPRFADFKEQARKIEAAPEAAYEKVVRHLTQLVGKLTPEEYDVMKRKVVLDDLSWEADRDHELPFGFTPETLREARANIDSIVNTMPKVVKAVRERKSANYALAQELVKAGVLGQEQIQNPAYYRHMVLDFARAQIEAAKNGGTIMVGGKPVRVRTPYWAKRKGSSLDINSNLLEAEADWMLKAYADIETAKALNWLKDSEHNIRETLRQKAKAENDELYAEELKHNPSAAKEDGRLRSMMARGFDVVKSVIQADALDIPDDLLPAADSLVTGDKSANVIPLLSWIMDGSKPGSDGAAMVLSGMGGRKKLMRQLLEEKFADPEDIKELVKRYRPEGYTDWQPLEGQHLFTAKTVSEHVLELFASKLADTSYPGVDKAELERAMGQVRSQLVVGRDRYTMVIPEEIAATLNDFGDKATRNMFLSAVASLQGKWKQYILINPRRWFRYNFNNMTGDLDALIAGKASALGKLPQAWRELRSIALGGAMTDAYREALDRGVFQAGITRQEVPDINQFKGLRHLERQKAGFRPDRLAIQTVANIWSALKDSTQFRESLFRYATYLKYKEEIDAGKAQRDIGYGASIPGLVDAVEDPADRAALLARELIGDYGNISVFGARMRRYIMPFWSWPEINTKRYFRLTANAFSTSYARGAATGGLLGAGIAARTATGLFVRMALVYTLINLWNRLLHGDDEDKLDDQQQRQLHLILGHDANGQVYTLRMQGALSDVLDELGFSDTVEAFKDWEKGQGSFSSILTATPKAIVNRVGPGNWNPLYMEPIQLALREKLWPDMFQPRTIHDRARDVAQTFSLENEYDWFAEKPSQGYGRSWVQSLAYQRDPGEMAYNNTRDLIGQWMKDKEGLDIGRSDVSPRSEALRDYKLALKYGDLPAARKALEDYAKYEGTVRGLKASIKGAAPLHPLPKRDRAAFIASLTDDQRQELIEAQKWYEETYLGRNAQ